MSEYNPLFQVPGELGMIIFSWLQDAQKRDEPLDVAFRGFWRDNIKVIEQLTSRGGTSPTGLSEADLIAQKAAAMARDTLETMLETFTGEKPERARYPFLFEDPVHLIADGLLSANLGGPATPDSSTLYYQLGDHVVQREVQVMHFDPDSPWSDLNDLPYSADYLILPDRPPDQPQPWS